MCPDPCHMDLHPGRNIYLTSCFILSVLFLTGGEMSVVPTRVHNPQSHGSPTQKNICNAYLTGWFILSVLFLTGGEMSVVPTYVWDPLHTDLHSGRNVYMTSQFILSVLYLTGSETSVVPTCVQDPLSH